MATSELMQMAAGYGGGRSGRLSDLLRGMPDTNNGSTMGGIASVLQKALLGYQMGQEQQALKDTMEGATAALQSRPGAQDAPGPNMDGSAGYNIAAKAPDTKLAANLLMQNPETQRMGFQMVTQNMAYDEAQKRAAEDAAMRKADRAESRGWAQEDRAAQQGFQEKMFGMQGTQAEKMARLQAALSAGNRLPQAPIAILGPDGKPQYVAPRDAYGKQPYEEKRQSIVGMTPEGQPIMGDPTKPQLPTAALKMQQEELDAIGAASSMRADLGSVNKMLDDGKLSLGPIDNLLSKGRNATGFSDENSRNFASFNATLEKARNDSLRLNKGVQTEGDAVRAWNELLSNVNDPELVKQRLAEIDKLNERAAGLRRNNIDVIRSNFGQPPLNTSRYENVAPAIGGGGLSASEAEELAALRARFGR